MRPRPTKSTLTDTLFPYTALFQSYATAMFGKWHINQSPAGIGFDDWKVLDDQGEYYNPDIITPKGRSVVEGYATDLITQYSLDWLKPGRDKAKPFAILIRSEEHTSELQSLMRISYAVFCLKTKK